MSNVVYVLFDDKGEVRCAGLTLDAATRYLKPGDFTTEEWNAIFGSQYPFERRKIYESKGWKVMHVELRMGPGDRITVENSPAVVL